MPPAPVLHRFFPPILPLSRFRAGRWLRRLLPALLCVLRLTGTQAQEYLMQHFTDVEGLPSNMVYDIYRDRTGYLWFCTDKGVARFNGRRFERFSTFNGLADNENFFCLEDLYGRLWFAGYNGGLCYYEHGEFHSALNTPALKLPFRLSNPSHISIERDSSVSFLFHNFPAVVNFKHEKLTVIPVRGIHFIKDLIQSVKKVPPDRYEVLTCRSRIVVSESDPAYNKIYKLPFADYIYGRLTQGREYFHSYQPELFTHPVSHYWPSVYDHNLRLLRERQKALAEDKHPHKMFFEGNDLYVSTDYGVYRNDSVRILPGERISTVNTDVAGNFWLASLVNGVYQLPKGYEDTRLLRHVTDGHVLHSFFYKGRVFFINDHHELYEIDGDNAVLRKKLFAGLADKSFVTSWFIKDHYLYYVYLANTLCMDMDRFEAPVRARPHFDFGGTVKQVLIRDSDLYMRTSYNVTASKIPTADVKLMIWRNMYNPEHDKCFYLALAPDRTVWASWGDRLSRITTGDTAFRTQIRNLSLRNFDFFGDCLVGYNQNNRLLVVSNYGSARPVIDTVNEENCIWDKFYRLDSTHLLIGTNNLYRIVTVHPKGSRPAFTISVMDYPFIPLKAESICCNERYAYFFKDGQMSKVPVDKLVGPTQLPSVRLISLTTMKRAYAADQPLELSADEAQNIGVRFQPFSFSSHPSRDIAYEYALSSGDDDDNWQTIMGQNINLANPGAGTYTLKVRIRGAGDQRGAPAIFTFRILPPLWLNWYFVVLYIVAFAILVYLVATRSVRYLIRQKEKVYDRRVKFLYSEYKAMNALMNPHFIFNVLNNLQSLINRSERELANSYLVTLSKMIRQNMHNVSEGMIPLRKELEMVANYVTLEKLRFKDSFVCTLTVDPEVPATAILVPPLLIQPLVENSIKHGFQYGISARCVIDVRVRMDQDQLVIEITDNGIGLSNASKNSDASHESFGLSNIKKRLEQFSLLRGYRIAFQLKEITEDGRPTGTRVTILVEMPVEEMAKASV